jgi:ferredoxin
MQAIPILHFLTGSLVAGFLLLFCVTSCREGRVRAAVISASGVIITAVCFWLLWLWIREHPPLLLLPTASLLATVAIILFPGDRPRMITGCPGAPQVDERNTIFAREEYRPGSDRYRQYYELHPELKRLDDRIRGLPELLSPGGRLHDPHLSPLTEQIFVSVEALAREVDGPVDSRSDEPASPGELTSRMKHLTLELGADEVGIATLDRSFVYSHVGRGPEPWGERIENNHRFAIVFSLEMDSGQVAKAPRAEITHESARNYLRGARIANRLAAHIRDLGFSARAQNAGSNYQIILPPVAADAGLGELGRFGYLISHRLGARVRLGAVTTDLPLMADKPLAGGVREFCEICKRCARNCPSAAIPDGSTTEVRGVEKWPLRVEACLQFWRQIGTDCGLCMRTCPFSHPNSFVHSVIRRAISRSSLARKLSLRGENLFYGKGP